MTTPSSTPGSLPAGIYRIDPERSTVHANVKAMFGLLTVKGTFRLKDGEVQIADDPARSTIRATIDATSYASGNDKRDRDVTSPALLDAVAYPEIVFTATTIRPEGSGSAVDGSLTAHGTTNAAAVRVSEVSVDGAVTHFHASADLDRNPFGVTRKKGMVGSSVAVHIDAVAVQT